MDAEFQAQNALLSILRGKNGKWMPIMTYCPPNCPNRALHCHGTCQHYQKAYILHKLTDKRAARRASDERAFHAERMARMASGAVSHAEIFETVSEWISELDPETLKELAKLDED